MASFWQFLDDRVKGREKNIPWFVNDKLRAYKFFNENRIPTPEISKTFKLPGDVDFDVLGDNFCIKPTVMHSAAGVLPLIRVAETSFFDRLRKRIISSDAAKKELQLSYDNCQFKGSFNILVEEGLGHTDNEFLIPFDYKFYTFKSGVGLILQVDRNSSPARLSFFDGDFKPVYPRDLVKNGFQSSGVLSEGTKPKFAEQMLAQAERCIEILDTPYISVDMYATKTGFYVGEITPAPGATYYKQMVDLSDEWDKKLGAMWQASL